MKIENKRTSLQDLGPVKEELRKEEPIEEGSSVTEAMLKSPVSGKLLKYFFEIYSDVIQRYIKKDPSCQQFIDGIKKILSTDGDLSGQNNFYLRNLYVKFMRKIPINESSNKGAIFNETARQAGCRGEEIVEARKLLNAFIEPAWQKVFGDIELKKLGNQDN